MKEIYETFKHVLLCNIFVHYTLCGQEHHVHVALQFSPSLPTLIPPL